MPRKLGTKPREYEYTRLCLNCDKRFRTNRVNRKFCSDTCRYAHWNKRYVRVLRSTLTTEKES